MKMSEIRELGREESQRKLSDLREELFNLRFQHEIGQLENTAKLKMLRQDIARINTTFFQKPLIVTCQHMGFHLRNSINSDANNNQ
jgi:large subunit ribosomal protein L29